MARTVITAADVAAAAASGSRQMVVPPGAILTPLARDNARDAGLTLIEGGAVPPAATSVGSAVPPPAAAPEVSLEARVRSVLATVLGAGAAAPSTPSAAAAPAGAVRPIKVCPRDAVAMEPFPFDGPGPDMRVEAVDVITAADGSPMAAGFLSLTKGSFPWTLTYDEVQIVIEGELHLGSKDGVKIGKPGDILYVPKGSEITFGTPSWAKLIYVTFPADWAEGL